MPTFTIDSENNITAHASLKEARAADLAGAEYFSGAEELTQLAASWPIAGTRWRGSSKLKELWSSLPGVSAVKKFPDRQTALAKIWEAAQALTPPGGAPGAHGAPKPKGSRKNGRNAPRRARAGRRPKRGRPNRAGRPLRRAEKAAAKPETAARRPRSWN